MQRHRLTVYATKEGFCSETFVHLKIVQTLVWIRNQVKMVIDLKRLSPDSTGELCAVKAARIVRRGLCLREGT